MSKHDDDTCPHLVRASLLETENARLKTEVEHLMIFCNCTLIPNKELQDENARLKAEVARLIKAGDAMAKRTEFFQKRWDADELCQEIEEWNAAKEGKPSV